MEKLKIDKKKHNHKLTDLLKIAIFSLIMLAPMFAIASKCLYVACNKNANESYSGTTYIVKQPVYYETNEVEDYNDLIINQIYHYSNNFQTIEAPQTNMLLFTFYATENIKEQFNLNNNVNELTYYIQTDGKPYVYYIDSIVRYENIVNKPFDFVIKSYRENISYIDNIIQYFSKSEMKLVKEYIDVTQQETLDNVFYMSVNDIKNQTLFNWTTDTAIYSAINGMCNGLAVQDGVLPILLTYWSLMTAIYIVFDLIIFTFTKITHFVNSD